MNREEAIEVLQKHYPDICYSMLKEAVDMAIKVRKTQNKFKRTIKEQPTVIEAEGTDEGSN